MTRLCYRGICYQKKVCTFKVSQKKTIGKYRGLAYSSSSLRVPTNYNFKLQIKYRGAAYV